MARRRLVTDEIIFKKEFNALSIEAQAAWTRILVKTDDCGVVPADPDELRPLTNMPPKINVEKVLAEYQKSQLGILITWKGKPYFVFNPATFDRSQSFILGKRTKSEYLRMSRDEFEAFIADEFQHIDIPGNSRNSYPNSPHQVESREQKVESKEIGGVGENSDEPKPDTVQYEGKGGKTETLLTWIEHVPPRFRAMKDFEHQWREWVKARRRKGKEHILTSEAAEWEIKQLEKFDSDPVDVVRQSAARKWVGLFEVKVTAREIRQRNGIDNTGGKSTQYQERGRFNIADTNRDFAQLEERLEALDRARGRDNSG